MPKTMDEYLKAAELPQQSVPICMRADVLGEIGELERRIKNLQDADEADLRLSAGDEAPELAARIRELEAEAAEYTMDLRLTAVPRLEWNKARVKHTTENDDGSEKLNLNAMMEDLFPQSVVSPEMTDGQRTDFLAGLTEGQWEAVIKAMWDINRGGASVPKSLRASMVRGQKSEKPEPDEQ